MSDCRKCGQLITFVWNDQTARWRPIEPSYTALDIKAGEVAATWANGRLTAETAVEIRVVTYHECPGDSSMRRGPAPTFVVTDETEGFEEYHEDEDEEEDEDPHWSLASRYTYCLKKLPNTVAHAQCPTCGALPQMPCTDVHGEPRIGAHPSRSLATSFEDDTPWPPHKLQRGYAAMKRWLNENGDIFVAPIPDRKKH